MAAYVKYEDFILQLFTAIHNFTAAGHVCKCAFHSDAPVVGTDDELADLTQVTGTGYTAGGIDVANDLSEAAGTATITGTDQTWTAGAADWTAGRYVSMHNDTSTTDKLINYWDYGSNLTLGNAETLTVDFGASWFTGT